MARIARVVAPGCPHHVVQRGNNHAPVFFSDADHRLYLAVLGNQCRRHDLALHAYCLMANHVRAGISAAPADYEWSTARPHLGLPGPAAIAIDNARWERLTKPTGLDWSEYLRAFEPGPDLDHLRACTSRGLPAGRKSFVRRLERQTDLRLTPQSPGRHRRNENIP